MELARRQCGTQQKIPRGVLVCFYKRSSTEVLRHHNIELEFARPLTLTNSLRKPLSRGFARNLRWSIIPVNEKDCVLLLTVAKPQKRCHRVLVPKSSSHNRCDDNPQRRAISHIPHDFLRGGHTRWTQH